MKKEIRKQRVHRRRIGGLFAYEDRKEELAGFRTGLDRLNERVDWEVFRPQLDGLVARKDRGRPPFDNVLMFKVLLLQKSNYVLGKNSTCSQCYQQHHPNHANYCFKCGNKL